MEVVIKYFEDREIINVGFGSNLIMDGIVECDVIVVDYLGRSGVCGVVFGMMCLYSYYGRFELIWW